MHPLTTYLTDKLPAMTDLLVEICRTESFSADKVGVDAVQTIIQRELHARGAAVTVFEQPETGNHVLGVWNYGAGSPVALILHVDTVHPRGSFDARFKIEGGKLYAPGVFDMKASSVIALYAVQALQDEGVLPKREIRMLFTSDEEIGSHTSEQLIVDTAHGAALAMVMEPALADGKLKSSRRGVGGFKVVTHGRASHAGGGHEQGINAIQEMAHHILKIQALTDYVRGIATTVSDIKGGVATNVVPDRCEIYIDTRANKHSDADYLTTQIQGLQPVLPEARIEISGGFERPPMECNDERLRIFERMKAIVAPIMALTHGPSGAGSDAAFTAPIAPTMDGLGAVGDGLHAVDEYIWLDSLVERSAMNALILRDW